jgi:hypothetical protein
MNNSNLFEDKDLEDKESGDDRRQSIDRRDLLLMKQDIKIWFMELERTMVSKKDIKEMVNEHETNCPLAKKGIFFLENAYTEWVKCKHKYDDELIDSFNKRYDFWKRIGLVIVGLGSGGLLFKIIQVITSSKL